MVHKLIRYTALVLLAVALGLVAVSAAPVAAAGISVNPSWGNINSTYTITASGFDPNEIVDTWVGLPNQTAVSTGTKNADSSGSVTVEFTPKSSYGAGEYIAVARGRSSGEISVKFQVDPAPGSDNNNNNNNNNNNGSSSWLPSASERTVHFGASGYQPGELVSTWFSYPNGTVQAWNNYTADAWGNVSFDFTVGANWMYGGYVLAARGARSHNVQSVSFAYFGGPVGDIKGSKPISNPTPAYTFSQGGFRANEPVSLWLGMPNGTSVGLAIVNANGSGVVNYTVTIQPGWQYGGYVIAGYGWYSKVTQWQRFAWFGDQPGRLN